MHHCVVIRTAVKFYPQLAYKSVPVAVAQNYAMVFHRFNNNISSYLVLLVHSLHSSIIHFRNRLFIFTLYFSFMIFYSFLTLFFSSCENNCIEMQTKKKAIIKKMFLFRPHNDESFFFNRHQVSPMCLPTITNK